MIHHRYSFRLCVITTMLGGLGLGCSSTAGLQRSAKEPKLRTIASIGDRPVASVAGTPTSSAVADLDLPGPATVGEGRVSGRVVDADGEPVRDARVRVADGGRAGGRIVEATTDRAGGFTLHGLRAGSSYTLIAEYEGQGGLVTGRSQARSPEADVEIALMSDDLPSDRRRASRPSSSRTISDRIELGEPTDDLDAPSRLNREDLPPADEVEELDDPPAETSSRRQSNVVPVSNSGWKPAGARTKIASNPAPIGDRSTRRASNQADEELEPQVSTRRDVPQDPPGRQSDGDYEDEFNPLPPAIERGVSTRTGVDPPGRPDEVSALPDESNTTLTTRQRPGPSPGAFALANREAPRPRPTVEPRPAIRSEIREDVASLNSLPPTPFRLPDQPKARDEEPEQVVEILDDPFRPKADATRSTTWADLGDAWRDVPPEVVEHISSESSDVARSVEAERPGPKSKRGEVEACRYDAKRRQIVDFRLPDLEGKSVSFKDFDSDLVLIDFWGTWCRPCLGSIPHLVELQKRMGPRKLAIVGIACEDGPASSSAKHVAEVAERLNINYSVLVSSRDASSPIQDALSIQAFPTMILVDREGRILWRDHGALPITLARLDRVLESSARLAENRTSRVRR